MKYILLLLFLFSSYFSSGQSHEYDQKRPEEPGKCYARCLIPRLYETEQDTFYEYIGDVNEVQVEVEEKNIFGRVKVHLEYIEDVEEVTIVTRPASTKWVKRRSDKNCSSADPDDCLVLCLQETPAEIETFIEVLDTSVIKDFHTRIISEVYLRQEGGFAEWREVVCEDDITEDFIFDLSEKLFDLGYMSSEVDDFELSAGLKAALRKYQKENDLPVGQLDNESLESLGLDMDY